MFITAVHCQPAFEKDLPEVKGKIERRADFKDAIGQIISIEVMELEQIEY